MVNVNHLTFNSKGPPPVENYLNGRTLTSPHSKLTLNSGSESETKLFICLFSLKSLFTESTQKQS